MFSVLVCQYKHVQYLFSVHIELALKLMLNRARPFTIISHNIAGFECDTLQLNLITCSTEVGQI